MSDENEFSMLIERMRAGSEEAARELFRRYGPHIIRVVRRRLTKRLRSKFDSQDFAQAVWASFFAMPPEACSFEHPEALAAYLEALARNKVIDVVRQRLMTDRYNVNREKSLEGSAAYEVRHLPDTEPRPSQLYLAEDEWERLLTAAPLHQRRILELLRDGVTPGEIAKELGVNRRTIRRLLLKLPSS